MTAVIIDLTAERAKRAKRRPLADAYNIDVIELDDHWAFRIELTGTGYEWHSERRYQTEDAARSDAMLAVRQLGQTPLQA